MRLTESQYRVLAALAGGWALKAHRFLDGRKLYQLHPPAGPAASVSASTVAALVERGLIDSNKKFPVATFWLTPAGKEAAGRR